MAPDTPAPRTVAGEAGGGDRAPRLGGGGEAPGEHRAAARGAHAHEPGAGVPGAKPEAEGLGSHGERSRSQLLFQ